MLKKIAILAATWALSGCATMNNLSTDYSLDRNPTQSVVIIGVKPDDRFGVEEGALARGQFKWDPGATPIFALYPKDGYIVAKMDMTKPSQIYALTNLMESIHHYRACGSKPIDTFTVEPGKIIYLGDFEFASPPVGLKHTITYDPDSAEKFIRQNYPKLKDAPFITQHTVPRLEIGFWQTEIQGMVVNCD